MMRVLMAAAVALLAGACAGGAGSVQEIAESHAGGAITQEIPEADLPEPVRAAVRSHPRAVLRRALKVTSGETVSYNLTLSGTRKTHMVVAADGRVISFE
jgi:hypothetical protein